MDRWLYVFIVDALEIGGLLYLYENFYQAIWLAVIMGIASSEGQKQLFKLYRDVPYTATFKIYDVLIDALWVLFLAACGKTFLAIFLAIGKLIRHGLVLQARNFSLEKN